MQRERVKKRYLAITKSNAEKKQRLDESLKGLNKDLAEAMSTLQGVEEKIQSIRDENERDAMQDVLNALLDGNLVCFSARVEEDLKKLLDELSISTRPLHAEVLAEFELGGYKWSEVLSVTCNKPKAHIVSSAMKQKWNVEEKAVYVRQSAIDLAVDEVESAAMDSKNACFDDPWDNGGRVFGEQMVAFELRAAMLEWK